MVVRNGGDQLHQANRRPSTSIFCRLLDED
nr:MAG TPA: hypothetical protein [Caudoviricetes sp.]